MSPGANRCLIAARPITIAWLLLLTLWLASLLFAVESWNHSLAIQFDRGQLRFDTYRYPSLLQEPGWEISFHLPFELYSWREELGLIAPTCTTNRVSPSERFGLPLWMPAVVLIACSINQRLRRRRERLARAAGRNDPHRLNRRLWMSVCCAIALLWFFSTRFIVSGGVADGWFELTGGALTLHREPGQKVDTWGRLDSRKSEWFTWPEIYVDENHVGSSMASTIRCDLPLWALLLVAIVQVGWLAHCGRRVPPLGHCAKCGYNLHKNTSGVCPECGTKITESPAVPAQRG